MPLVEVDDGAALRLEPASSMRDDAVLVQVDLAGRVHTESGSLPLRGLIVRGGPTQPDDADIVEAAVAASLTPFTTPAPLRFVHALLRAAPTGLGGDDRTWLVAAGCDALGVRLGPRPDQLGQRRREGHEGPEPGGLWRAAVRDAVDLGRCILVLRGSSLVRLDGIEALLWRSADGTAPEKLAARLGCDGDEARLAAERLIARGLFVYQPEWRPRDDLAWCLGDRDDLYLARLDLSSARVALIGWSRVIWEILVDEGGASLDRVLDLLHERHGLDPEAVRKDVALFLQSLASSGFAAV